MKEIQIGKVTIGQPNQVVIQGVINLSPESFYKGSIKTKIDEIVSTAKQMESNGAQIIDVGAMSTAPYLETQIPPKKEKERIVEGISKITKEIDIPVSIDTTRASTAEAALENGADLVNDISGFTSDKSLPNIIKEYNVPVIIGAYNIERFSGNPVNKVIQALKSSMAIGEKAGIPRKNFILDPDIGFHRKTEYEWYEIDSHLLANLQAIIDLLLGDWLINGNLFRTTHILFSYGNQCQDPE
jgi:dihydropteroate synthase